MFTCPVDGNPKPIIEWYNEKTGVKISSGKQLEARESGCYTCVASNSLGTSVNISQCLIVVFESCTKLPSTTVSGVHESSTTVPSTTVSGGQEIRAILTIITNYDQTFKDLNSASSKEFVAWFEKEVNLSVALKSTRNFLGQQLLCRFFRQERNNLQLELSLKVTQLLKLN
ncbi:uncharacterized protein LOC122948803 [Acropora millepora]|uniref:uncharacterized protein LOC122948803 n=1 Tax=Acropora millepora TaxID=45264 RepID=UPI001CF5D203|nr:uncharacterized protein LOC122948803 [Acropora millepora]